MTPSAIKQRYCERLRVRVFGRETFSTIQCHLAQSGGNFSGVCQVFGVIIFG